MGDDRKPGRAAFRRIAIAWLMVVVAALSGASGGCASSRPPPPVPAPRASEQGTIGLHARVVREDSPLRDLTAPPLQWVVVTRVDPQGPADRAGIRPGDVIAGIEGRSVRGAADAISGIRGARPGTEISLEMRRGDERYTVRVPVLSLEPDPRAASRPPASGAPRPPAAAPSASPAPTANSATPAPPAAGAPGPGWRTR